MDHRDKYWGHCSGSLQWGARWGSILNTVWAIHSQEILKCGKGCVLELIKYSSLDLFFELQVCMATWISDRLLKPNVSQCGLFIYLARAVPFPAFPVVANGATPTRNILVMPVFWPPISSVSYISLEGIAFSLPFIMALSQVFPVSPLDYSSNLLIALHSSNESLVYSVLVFFPKQQSDLIPCF